MKPFYKNILNGLPTQLAVVQKEGNIIFANAAWKQFAKDNGAFPENVSENVNYFHVCDDAQGDHSDGSKSFADGIRRVQSGLKSSFVLEYPCHSPTEERWFLGYVTPCPGNESGLVVVTHQNITGQKKLASRLQQAQKLESIGSLSGGIAHDFNNLLFPIIGLSELLLDDLAPGSPDYEKVEEILKAGNRGSQLVSQILSFSRQEVQKRVPIRIGQVVKEVIKLARSTIPAYIDITQSIDPDCGLVMADPTHLHQIAMNLVTNAYHAIEKNTGCIDIKVKEICLDSENLIDGKQNPGKYVILIVSDNGSGIAPTHLEKIFDPYFTTKEKGKGTGLGLSTVYGIVKEYQGDIKVYSEPGRGTTFNVFFPLIQKTDPPESDEKVETIETGKETILLVDDEISIVRLEKQMLERLGYQVITRTASMDALAAFKSRPEKYDLVISDMNMPNMNGVELAKEIHKTRPDMPIVICTGFSEKLSREITKDMGIRGVLMKPITKSEMARVVRNALDEVKVFD